MYVACNAAASRWVGRKVLHAYTGRNNNREEEKSKSAIHTVIGGGFVSTARSHQWLNLGYSAKSLGHGVASAMPVSGKAPGDGAQCCSGALGGRLDLTEVVSRGRQCDIPMPKSDKMRH